MGQFLLFFVVMGHPEDEVKATAGHELPSLEQEGTWMEGQLVTELSYIVSQRGYLGFSKWAEIPRVVDIHRSGSQLVVF